MRSSTCVLVIDDDEAIRESFSGHLEDCGFRVLSAENGRVGLEVFERRRPDIVLVDLRMPEMDGFEVLSRIKEQSSEIPLIVVSGTGELGDAIEAVRRGAWDYLTKPVEDLSALTHAIHKALERAGLIRENRQYQEHLEKKVAERTEELQRANRQIKAALAEKETLLRELYHRTKNNMQVIRSMLALQAAYSQNEEVQYIVQETERKIHAMALAHQKLYQSQDLSRINLQDYITELAYLLMQSYNVSSNRISLLVDVENVSVLIDTAIPCGLIINELMSNALKHAFPGDMNGEIHIRLFKTDQGEIELYFSDNGVGVPNGFDFTTQETLGLQTIFAIGEQQMQGTVRFETNTGTTCHIKFPDKLYKPRV